jgi:hypothetical protein
LNSSPFFDGEFQLPKSAEIEAEACRRARMR